MADEKARQAALTTAANVLEYKNRSRRALVKRLVEKGIEEPDALYAAGRLEELGLLDDLTYARALAESYGARGYGRGYIRNALRQKLVDAEVIGQVLEGFEPADEKIDKYIAARMGGKPADKKLVKKVSDGLYRRGLSWDEIRAAMARYTNLLEEEPLE